MSNRYSAFLTISDAIDMIVGDLVKKDNPKNSKKEKKSKTRRKNPNELLIKKLNEAKREKKEEVEEKIKNKNSKNKDLEGDIDSEDLGDKELDDDLPFSIDYSFHEEQLLAENFYKQAAVDYVKLFYGDTGARPPVLAAEDEYRETSNLATDVDAECLTTEEASKTMMDIQYATMLGATHEVNLRQRKKFDTWIKFNSALFKMMESMHSVTSDVNYSLLT